MPEPAIYVVVRDGAWFHTGDNLGGYEVDQVLALGPDITTRYVDALVRARAAVVAADPQGFWVAYCSGGALIDFDRRRLVVFTYQLDPGRRLAYLDALTRAWPGWDVGWAYRWMFDLAAYPGVAPPVWPDEGPDEPDDPVTELDDLDDDDPRAVVTVATGSTVRAYEVRAYEPKPWAVGPALLDLLREDQRTTGLDQVPVMGLHLDLDRTRAGVWTTRWWYDIDEWWPRAWPGWSLDLWSDRADEQVARAGGTLVLPAVDLAKELERYGRRLDHLWSHRLRETRDQPIDPASAADAVDLSQAEYLEARRRAITR